MATVVRQVTLTTTVTQIVIIPPRWTAQIYWMSSTNGGQNAFVGIGKNVNAGNGWIVSSTVNQAATFGVDSHEPQAALYGIADKGTVTICVAMCHM